MGIQHYIKVLTLPLLFFVLFTTLFVLWEVFDLPSAEELTQIVQGWFDKYGLPSLFLASIIEGVLLIGGYFPGVFVIFLGVILARSVFQAVQVVVIVTAGLFLAHLFNYALGRYGWYRLLVKFGLKAAVDRARERLVKRGPIAIFLSYWLPSIGALTDTAAGIVQMPFKKFFFYSLVSVMIWNTIAGTLVYSFKDIALSIASPASPGRLVIFAIIFAWAFVALVMDYYERKYKVGKATPDSDS